MKTQLKFKMNEKLYLKNPEESTLGKSIIANSICLIYELGFEKFTFKKLATEIGTTEAGVYRYFGNKHKLLVYLTNWYWNWLEFQIESSTKHIRDPKVKLKIVIGIICSTEVNSICSNHIDGEKLHHIMIREGTKAYLTQNITEDNKDKLFKPYKDLCLLVSKIISECDNNYKFPRSLASGLIEMAHFQTFFKRNIPALTDFEKDKAGDDDIIEFLETMAFSKLAIK